MICRIGGICVKKRFYLFGVLVFLIAVFVSNNRLYANETDDIEIEYDIGYTHISNIVVDKDGPIYEEDTWDTDEGYEYIMYERGVLEGIKPLVHAYVDLIPEPILEKFKGWGYEIVITRNLIPYGKDNMDYVVGLLSTFEKRIYVHDGRVSGLIHEMGHFFDYFLVSVEGTHRSQTDEWKDLYREEGCFISVLDMQSMANVYNETECFAEAFSHYVFKRDYSEVTPKIYALMKDLVDNYHGDIS